jgi:hypothetical protein
MGKLYSLRSTANSLAARSLGSKVAPRQLKPRNKRLGPAGHSAKHRLLRVRRKAVGVKGTFASAVAAKGGEGALAVLTTYRRSADGRSLVRTHSTLAKAPPSPPKPPPAKQGQPPPAPMKRVGSNKLLRARQVRVCAHVCAGLSCVCVCSPAIHPLLTVTVLRCCSRVPSGP